MIREATRADVDALLDLQGRCFGVDAWSRTQVEEELGRPGGIFLVDDELRGFVIGWVVFDDLHLLQIATSPDARRSGVAGELQAALFAAARMATQAFLEVRADNAPAIAFYLHHAWQPIGRRPRYYADAVDALVFRRSL